MKRILDAFSHAVVINLETCPERLRTVSQRLDDLGIPFERFQAIRPDIPSPHIGTLGCRLSHLEIVREAQRKGLESVLIIEDDVVFREDFPRHWAVLLPQLLEAEYDIFYGYDWSNRFAQAENIRLKQIIGTFCCHFWAIHSRFYQKFIETIETKYHNKIEIAVDRIFSSRMAKIYAPTYNLVGQDEGLSTIDGLAKGFRWSM